MNKTKVFDVLVVYTNAIASSASSKKHIKSPFQMNKRRTHYNDAYAYLLESCEKNNLQAAFATAKDIIGSGTASCYWIYQNKKWTKVNRPCFSKLIFDKVSPFGARQKQIINLLFSNPKVKPFNSPALFSLFFDKQKTFNELQDFAIPTVSVENNSIADIEKALLSLEQLTSEHSFSSDFSNKIIIKDRFGSGGNSVYLLDSLNPGKEVLKIMHDNRNTRFILQPFAEFKTGYTHNNRPAFIDIRMIYVGKKVVQVYLRKAKDTDFRCNEHQGGELHYITLKDVPLKVRKFSKRIVEALSVSNELYALDLVVSNNGNVFLMEGNIRPGIDWNLSLKKNERMAKKLIRVIVGEFKNRVNEIPRRINYPVVPQTEVISAII